MHAYKTSLAYERIAPSLIDIKSKSKCETKQHLHEFINQTAVVLYNPQMITHIKLH